MRRCIILAVVTASLFAAAPVAADDNGTDGFYPPTVAGYLGMYGGIFTVPGGGGQSPVFAANAVMAWSFGHVTVQFGAQRLAVFEVVDHILSSLEIHAFWRNAAFAGGVFGMIENYDFDVGVQRNWYLGVESIYFVNRFALYGQTALLDAGGTLVVSLLGSVRYFPRDNIRGEGGICLLLAPGSPLRVWTFFGEVEYAFAQWPVSLVGTLRFIDTNLGIDTLTATIGFRVLFGEGDLIDQRAPMRTLPFVF